MSIRVVTLAVMAIVLSATLHAGMAVVNQTVSVTLQPQGEVSGFLAGSRC